MWLVLEWGNIEQRLILDVVIAGVHRIYGNGNGHHYAEEGSRERYSSIVSCDSVRGGAHIRQNVT